MGWFPNIFKILGLWPPKDKKRKFFYYCLYIPIFAFFTLHLNISEIIQCYLDRNDFKQTLLNLGIIVLHLIATMRIIHWHFARNNCVGIMKQLFKRRSVFEEEEIRTANRQACTLYFGVIFLMFCDIFVSYISVRFINAKQNTQILPYNTYFFFDAEKYYDIAWFYQFISILYTMYQMGRELLKFLFVILYNTFLLQPSTFLY